MDNTSKRIYEIFKDININPSNLGYTYSMDAVKMCLEDPTYISGITRRLYPEIAAARNTAPTRVERAIRHVISLMFTNGVNKTDLFIKIFGEKEKMTNKTFIASLVEYIKYNS